VSRRKNERERGQNAAIDASYKENVSIDRSLRNLKPLTNNSQCISPSYTAKSDVEAVCVWTTNLSELIGIPSKWETRAGDDHRDRWKWKKKRFSINTHGHDGTMAGNWKSLQS